MKLRVLMLAAMTFGWPAHAGAADPGSAPTALDQPPPPATAPVTADKPSPVEPPKPVARPRPIVEKPQPVPPPPTPPDAAQPEAPPAPPPAPVEPPPAAEPAPPPGSGFTAGCWLLAFAMLIIGFAAGFIGRYFWSRRQLGGMTVRIGTWRGIP